MLTMNYNAMLRRNRQRKTNYRKREALLISRSSFITVRISNQNVICQVLKPSSLGDIVICSVHSRELRKYGWKGSMNNLPACYIIGFLLGKKSIEKGTNHAILYTGKHAFTSRIAAALKGLIDAGLDVPVSKDILPTEERIRGGHIAEYAKILKEDQEKYNTRFSSLLKDGLQPQDYPSHFEATLNRISNNLIQNI